jgi:hypothetical protein
MPLLVTLTTMPAVYGWRFSRMCRAEYLSRNSPQPLSPITFDDLKGLSCEFVATEGVTK